MRLALVLAALLLAGCASAPTDGPSAPGTEDEAGDASVGLVLADLTSRGCAYNDLIFTLPRAQVQALLPEGFVARPFFNDAVSAVVMNVVHCEEGFAWSGADYFAVVDRIVPPPAIEAFDAANRTPRVEETEGTLWLDIYMLGAYTGHEGLTALFGRAGMTVESATVSKTALPAPVGSAARGEVVDDAGPVVAFTVTGRDVGALTASHRQWRASPEGLVLVERFMSLDGAGLDLTQGPANCVVRPGSSLANVVGDAPCVLGQDTTNGFAWEGRAYLFPGTTGATLAGESETLARE